MGFSTWGFPRGNFAPLYAGRVGGEVLHDGVENHLSVVVAG